MIFSDIAYEEMLEWLFTRFPSYQRVGDRAFKPGLDTMREFMSRLEFPQSPYKVIHIAGTNGKGSVSHMTASALACCGMKVGLYTSPHLVDFRERLKIISKSNRGCSYEMISKEEVFSFMERYREFFDNFNPSFFEITTAMAFDWFRSCGVDIAVIECGLGGRLDSTNVVNPLLSVITNIGLEHCEYLGHTLQEIAREKAGIIKPVTPVLIGESIPETRSVFEQVAIDVGTSELFFAEEFPPFLPLSPDEIDLKGDYQHLNLRTVSAIFEIIRKKGLLNMPDSGPNIEKLSEGVSNAAAYTGLHGRWESLRKAANDGGISGKAPIICDTAHNAHAMRWIREQIDKISCDYDNIFFILGVVADKDVDSIASYLPRDVHFIFTNSTGERALPAAKLADRLSDHGINGRITTSVKEALEMADSLAGEEDLIFICGSNFVVAEVLEIV
jgi:dihydrofolate synthase/folylpolyglutamate synthase